MKSNFKKSKIINETIIMVLLVLFNLEKSPVVCLEILEMLITKFKEKN